TSRRLEPLARAVARITTPPRNLARTLRRRSRHRATTSGGGSVGAERALAAAIAADLEPPTVVSGPLVSIIILSHDGRALLERCLGRVARSAYRDFEIVLVDNGSSDGSADYVERLRLGVPVRVIRNPDNRNFAEAHIQAVAVAEGDLLCFLNND